jgi:hypothetical protein
MFDIAQRHQYDSHTQEETELGSAIRYSYVAQKCFVVNCRLKPADAFGCMLQTV